MADRKLLYNTVVNSSTDVNVHTILARQAINLVILQIFSAKPYPIAVNVYAGRIYKLVDMLNATLVDGHLKACTFVHVHLGANRTNHGAFGESKTVAYELLDFRGHLRKLSATSKLGILPNCSDDLTIDSMDGAFQGCCRAESLRNGGIGKGINVVSGRTANAGIASERSTDFLGEKAHLRRHMKRL